MGKRMPLKWIEAAEAREVCVIAVSEAVPHGPRLLASAALMPAFLSRLRLWLAPAPPGGVDDKPLVQVGLLRKIGRQTLSD